MFLLVFMQIWHHVRGKRWKWKWKKKLPKHERKRKGTEQASDWAKARVNKYASYRLKILIIQDFWARKLVWHVLEIKFRSWCVICERTASKWVRDVESVKNEECIVRVLCVEYVACCLLLVGGSGGGDGWRWQQRIYLGFSVKFYHKICKIISDLRWCTGLFSPLLLLLAS